MGNLVFVEDEPGSRYTQLKKQAAVRVGIEFSVEEISMHTPVTLLQDKIRDFCQRRDFVGVMVQKPSKADWNALFQKQGGRFDAWWQMLTYVLDPAKDVDCLHVQNLQRVHAGKWRLLPATVKAIITVLQHAQSSYQIFGHRDFNLSGINAVVVGRSDIVGSPVASVLAQYGASVFNYGVNLDLAKLAQADLVVSATGQENLLKPDMLKPGVVIIDVGYPRPDVDPTVAQVAKFFTPVPYGVGPVTVISLLENVYELGVVGV